MAGVKAEMKALPCRKALWIPTEVVIGKLNELVRGWVGYFYYGNCSRPLEKLHRSIPLEGELEIGLLATTPASTLPRPNVPRQMGILI